MLIDEQSMMEFACKGIDDAIKTIPTSAITHPAIVLTLVFAHAFGMNWQRLKLLEPEPEY